MPGPAARAALGPARCGGEPDTRPPPPPLRAAGLGRCGLAWSRWSPSHSLAWLGGLSSSAGTGPGRGLAGASPLRFELPSVVSTRWRNRATRLHSHWLSQDFFGLVCPLFARKLEKPRKKSGRGCWNSSHSPVHTLLTAPLSEAPEPTGVTSDRQAT